MKCVAIIQARMGSSRLPGKVVKDLSGEPMLIRVMNRVRRARSVDEAIVATTDQARDDVIEAFCLQYGHSCFRGSEADVLDRYYRAALKSNAGIVVRITSDCPLIEPQIIDDCIKLFQSHRPDVDYVSNTVIRRTFPRGLDAEVISMEALERAWHEDKNPQWREHVTPYIYRNNDTFRVMGLFHSIDYSAMRWTVDTSDDLELITRIYAHFRNDSFSWLDVIELMKEHPEWMHINDHVKQNIVV